jgi:hypothetical protein
MANDQRLQGASGPVQVIPPGLLGFLNLKNTGQAPGLFGGTVQPVWDMLRWYLSANATDVPFSTTGQASGTFGLVLATGAIVPAREWWYVHYYRVSTDVLAAGDRVSFSPGLLQNATVGGRMYTIGPNAGTPTTATTVQTVWTTNAQDFFVAPGFGFGPHINQLQLAAGALVFDIALRYTPLPI